MRSTDNVRSKRSVSWSPLVTIVNNNVVSAEKKNCLRPQSDVLCKHPQHQRQWAGALVLHLIRVTYSISFNKQSEVFLTNLPVYTDASLVIKLGVLCAWVRVTFRCDLFLPYDSASWDKHLQLPYYCYFCVLPDQKARAGRSSRGLARPWPKPAPTGMSRLLAYINARLLSNINGLKMSCSVSP